MKTADAVFMPTAHEPQFRVSTINYENHEMIFIGKGDYLAGAHESLRS